MRPSGLEPPGGRAPSQALRTVAIVAKSYREVRQALAAAGWVVARQRGSHEVWIHPERRERIIVAGKPSDTVPVGTLSSIRKASGIRELR
jgi:predicted RNA binding protein YcfA (HicA-like mRNA interferase family)